MRALLQAIADARRRLRALAARGSLGQVETPGPQQRVQVLVLEGEVRDRVERLQQYGFHSVPLAGAYPVAILCPHGDRGQALAICVDDVRSRPEGEPGDTIVYDHRGSSIRLGPAGIEVQSIGSIYIEAPGELNVNIGGAANVTVAGEATVAAPVAKLESADVQLGTGAMQRLCDERLIPYLAAHTHSGVTPGPGNTGAPTTPPAVVTHTTTETKAS